MNASDATSPVLRPYLPATADFAASRDSPRDFLERCLAALDAWEPRIGAFVTLNLPEARAAAERLAFVRRLSQRARWRERRRAARGRRGDRRQDRDHRVRGDRAARHPQ